MVEKRDLRLICHVYTEHIRKGATMCECYHNMLSFFRKALAEKISKGSIGEATEIAEAIDKLDELIKEECRGK